jgi:hypothetical protein
LISNKIVWLNQQKLQRIAAFILTFFAMPLAYSAMIFSNLFSCFSNFKMELFDEQYKNQSKGSV